LSKWQVHTDLALNHPLQEESRASVRLSVIFHGTPGACRSVTLLALGTPENIHWDENQQSYCVSHHLFTLRAHLSQRLTVALFQNLPSCLDIRCL